MSAGSGIASEDQDAAYGDEQSNNVNTHPQASEDLQLMPEANSLIVYEEVLESMPEEIQNLGNQLQDKDLRDVSSSSAELIVADERNAYEVEQEDSDQDGYRDIINGF